MTAQAPQQRDSLLALLAELWRDKLQPSRSGTGRETLSGRIIHGALFIVATLSAFVTVGIVLVLIFETVEFFRIIPFGDFFGSTEWSALFAEGQFGVWALVWGTLLVAALALAVAVPLGLLAAIFLSEYAPRASAPSSNPSSKSSPASPPSSTVTSPCSPSAPSSAASSARTSASTTPSPPASCSAS